MIQDQGTIEPMGLSDQEKMGLRAEAAREAASDDARIGWLAGQLAGLRKQMPLALRFTRGTAHGLMSAVAALLAYLPTQAIGFKEGFWAALTAVAVAQTEMRAAQSVARDQFIGAAIGGIAGVSTYLMVGSGIATYAAAILFAVLACWLANVATAARLSATTATIILLVPHVGTPEQMLVSRLFEVGWGTCAAIGTVWVVTAVNRRLGISV